MPALKSQRLGFKCNCRELKALIKLLLSLLTVKNTSPGIDVAYAVPPQLRVLIICKYSKYYFEFPKKLNC